MDSVKHRIPTRRELWLLFVAVVFPLNVWSILMFLHESPAYMRRMGVGDMFGIFSYSQAFALIESLVVLGALVFVCIALPRRMFKDKFVAQGTIFMFVTFIWIIPVHYQIQILDKLSWNMAIYQVGVVIWIITFFLAIVGMSLMIRRSQKAEQGANTFVEKLAVLSAIYILIDIVGFIVVIYRNLI